MWLIACQSRQMLNLSILVEVVEGTKLKEDHGFPDRPLIHPLLGVEVLIGDVIKAPGIPPQQELQEKVTNQQGQEEVLG